LLLAIPLLFTGPASQKKGIMALFPVWIMTGLVTVSSIAINQHRVDGQRNSEIVTADPNMGNVSNESWHAYGRSNLG
tara:strand:+ start:1979 stop:2209 length:231 start_codon:yes stop_codon:yes gene_type:complete